jgi:polyphosphate kinase
MNNRNFENQSYTQNRELSWLRFNDRVLDEAMDETVPLLERLKFISIFTSNLDEFFMIRVGSLTDLKNFDQDSVDLRSGMTAAEQLDAIYAAVEPLYKKREIIFYEVEKQLRLHGIYQLSYDELNPYEIKYVKNYFKTTVEPVLSPQIIDTHHPFPHLQNKVLHVGALLHREGKDVFGVIPLPTALPEVIFLPGDNLRCVRISEVIMEELPKVFKTYNVSEKTSFCVTRNADINPDDDSFDFGEDFRRKMKKALGKRRKMAPVRLEYSHDVSEKFLRLILERLSLNKKQSYRTTVPMNLSYVFEIPDMLGDTERNVLLYPEFHPQWAAEVDKNIDIMSQIKQKDILLSYPFESIDPFLRLLKEAAVDPEVISIKITIYRLAKKAKLVDYLCNAAENGKDVTVLIELRARFDEKSNIDWSERLEDSGCTVIYGFPEYKVHSKICLITRLEKNKKISYITQLGTGNYNEKTAAMYTDLSLMTADFAIGQDANEFFKNMAIGNLHGMYKHLLVAPADLKRSVIENIDQEITKGSEGRIIIKINSITDLDIIEKLKQASCAGVKISMIVRGICCVLPGIPGKTENLEIISIVGRYLEHSRIYCFGSGNEEKIYIASADFMTRNTVRRVEVAAPVYDIDAKVKIKQILDLCLADNVKSRRLQSDGTYVKVFADKNIDSQQQLMLLAIKNDTKSKIVNISNKEQTTLVAKIKTKIHSLLNK